MKRFVSILLAALLLATSCGIAASAQTSSTEPTASLQEQNEELPENGDSIQPTLQQSPAGETFVTDDQASTISSEDPVSQEEETPLEEPITDEEQEETGEEETPEESEESTDPTVPLFPLAMDEHVAYVSGDTQDRVNPNNNLTRAEAASLVYKLLTEPADPVSDRFSDVTDGQWFATAVNSLAAMGIVNRVSMFASSAMLGFGQGFQPVCGFNYGAQLYHRVSKAFWFCVKLAFGFLAAFAVVEFLFAPQIVAIFRRDDPEVIRIGTTALRLQCITLPLTAWIVICNMMCQTIGKAFKASVLAMARQGLFFLPLIWVLPPLVGMIGVQISQPVSDALTFVLAVPMGISVLREMQRDQTQLDTQQRGL